MPYDEQIDVKALCKVLTKRLRNKYVSWIKPRVTKGHHKSLERFCVSRGWHLTRSGLPGFVALTPDGEVLLIACRPSRKHRVRSRTYTLLALIEQAMARKKLHLCRYDPQTMLHDYHYEPEGCKPQPATNKGQYPRGEK